MPWTEQEAPTDEFISFFDQHEARGIAQDINADLNSPLFRLHLYHSSAVSYLAVSIHHSLYDGTALPLLLDSVEHIYAAGSPRHVTPMGDIISYIHSVDMDAAKQFWVSKFVGFDHDRNPTRQPSGRTANLISHTFKPSLATLEASAASFQVTLQAFMLSAFSLLLGNHVYGSQDVVFGVGHRIDLAPIKSDHLFFTRLYGRGGRCL